MTGVQTCALPICRVPSVFAGVMKLTIGDRELNVPHVVNTWFNCEFFHSEPLDPSKYSLEVLARDLGGEQQALALLAVHLSTSLDIIGEFLNDVCSVSVELRDAVTRLIGSSSAI